MAFRAPKQWTLTEKETITSFYDWQSNLNFHLSQTTEFIPFIDREWAPKSATNRGFTDDGVEVVDAAARKTAVQKCIVVERMLGLVAQFSPSLLRNDIIKRSTSLSWIWQRIRKYYSFTQSEVNFLKLSQIKLEEGERYETFFQRIIAHLEDNLLKAASDIVHDGEEIEEDEEMSPTAERLAVYLWMNLIDKRLPGHVSRVYAHEMLSRSLKDLQPQIVENMECLLSEINTQEDIRIQYSKSPFQKKQSKQMNPSTFRNNNDNGISRRPTNRGKSPIKSCVICKNAGRQSIGHDVGSCGFLSKFDKLELSKTFQVNVADDDDESAPLTGEENTSEDIYMCDVQKVQCDRSPFFYAFYQHIPCHVVVDTGAMSSLVSRSFVKQAGMNVRPTDHSARAVGKTPIGLHGEIQITLNFNGIELPLTALVIDNLDCDILAGVPFCKQNDIELHLKNEELSIGEQRFSYGTRNNSVCNDVFRSDSLVLRNNRKRVIMPGEYIELEAECLKNYEGEVAIEPREDSPNNGSWPVPELSRVIQGRIRIPNDSPEPISLSRSQHFAQIRRVTDNIKNTNIDEPPQVITSKETVDLITIDPNNLLSTLQKKAFIQTNTCFKDVFDPKFGAYNDASGSVRASKNMIFLTL